MVVVFCPQSCHNLKRNSSHFELPVVFRAAHPGIFRHLWAGSVKPCRPTMRAPDKWDSPRFLSRFLALGFSAPARCLPSAHLQVTLAVGQYLKDTIYVVHGCPEIARNEYAKGSGNLASFQVGDYHILHLTSQNVFKIGTIDPGVVQLPVAMNESTCATSGGCSATEFVQLQDGMMYFCSQVDSYSP